MVLVAHRRQRWSSGEGGVLLPAVAVRSGEVEGEGRRGPGNSSAQHGDDEAEMAGSALWFHGHGWGGRRRRAWLGEARHEEEFWQHG